MTGPPAFDPRTFVHLVDAGWQRVGGRDLTTGAPDNPARWSPGEIVVDDLDLTLPADGPTPIVEIGLYAWPDGRRLPIGDDTSVIVGVLPADPAAEGSALAEFEGGDRLIAAGPAPGPASADELVLRLTWRLDESPPADRVVFLHVVGPAGRVIAQADGPWLGGIVPADRWQPGDEFVEERRVRLPAGLSVEGLSVRVGLHDRETGRRVPVRRGGDPDAAVRVDVAR